MGKVEKVSLRVFSMFFKTRRNVNNFCDEVTDRGDDFFLSCLLLQKTFMEKMFSNVSSDTGGTFLDRVQQSTKDLKDYFLMCGKIYAVHNSKYHIDVLIKLIQTILICSGLVIIVFNIFLVLFFAHQCLCIHFAVRQIKCVFFTPKQLVKHLFLIHRKSK